MFLKKPRLTIDEFFFHATSLPALESIFLDRKELKSATKKCIGEPSVSTKPEKGFGRFILVFRENIARLSPLEHGFPRDESTYWAGFSHDIPVSIETLAFIAVVDEQLNECQQTAQDVQNWTGRDIPVISLDAVEERLRRFMPQLTLAFQKSGRETILKQV